MSGLLRPVSVALGGGVAYTGKIPNMPCRLYAVVEAPPSPHGGIDRLLNVQEATMPASHLSPQETFDQGFEALATAQDRLKALRRLCELGSGASGSIDLDDFVILLAPVEEQLTAGLRLIIRSRQNKKAGEADASRPVPLTISN
jgi:hypothetical protein